MGEYNFENSYVHALDQKNRVFIPAEYRSVLGQEFVVCTPPGSKNCIVVYPVPEWDKYFENLRQVCSGSDLALAERIANSTKKRTTPDKQGRITLSQEFCERAGLQKEALIMGVGNRVEIWNPETWRTTRADFDNNPPAWTELISL